MPDFSKRGTAPELMDTEATGFEDFRDCLEELVQVNGLFFPYWPTLSYLSRLHKAGRFNAGHPISIVDIGSGYGDALRRIDQWAQTRGIPVDLQGVDMNPWSARAASAVTDPGRPIRWISEDLFNYKPDRPIDIVISSLFTHHLPDPLLVDFIQWMEKTARMGWFVNDLQRHRVPYYALKAGFALTRRHRFVRHDGPVSVANAFSRKDWERSLSAAGLKPGDAQIQYWLPFRLCVARVKDEAR